MQWSDCLIMIMNLRDYLTYNLNLGWSYNTLNRPVFPTSGMSHRVNGEIALPGSDVEYQKITYDAQALPH